MAEYIPFTPPTIPSGTQNFTTAMQFTEGMAEASVISANSFVASLADLKQIDFSQVGDLPAFQSIVLLADMTQIGNRPVRPTVDLDIAALQQQLTMLTVPPAPTASFSYTDPGYSSAMRDIMITKLVNDMVNGGYGIDTTDEVALWNRERDREALLAQANIEELKRQAAATAFPMPQGALYAALQRARQDLMGKLSSVNRDIGLKRADLYVLNRQATLEKVLKTEEQSQALYNAIQNRALEIAKVQVQMAIALFEAGIKYFEGQLRSILAQIEAKVSGEKMKVELYTADVQAYAAYVNAIAQQARITVDNSKLQMDRDKTSYLGKVEMIKFRLEQLKTTVEMAKSINTFGADFFRTGLGASLSNISGIAVNTTTV